MDNLLTATMEKLTNILLRTDDKLKGFGLMPYGERKATKAEKQQKFNSLKVSDVVQMIRNQGRDSVNEYLRQHME